MTEQLKTLKEALLNESMENRVALYDLAVKDLQQATQNEMMNDVRNYRENVLCMTRSELAAVWDCSPQMIMNYESGNKRITQGYVEQLVIVEPSGNPPITPKRNAEQVAKVDSAIILMYESTGPRPIAEKLNEPVKYIKERASTLRKRGLIK